MVTTNNLTEYEQFAIQEHWNDGVPVEEVAAYLQIDLAVVQAEYTRMNAIWADFKSQF